jgi:hypothetical protein
VYRQQRARNAGAHVSNILSEDCKQERAVPAVDIPVQQLSTRSLSLGLSLRLSLSLVQLHKK